MGRALVFKKDLRNCIETDLGDTAETSMTKVQDSRKAVFRALIFGRLARLGAVVCLCAGCASVKSTMSLAEAEQAIYQARAAGAPEKAIYHWTVADEFIKKAREEWSHADYEAADTMAAKAVSWAEVAKNLAITAGTIEVLDDAPKVVPQERAEPTEPPPPTIRSDEDLLDFDFGED